MDDPVDLPSTVGLSRHAVGLQSCNSAVFKYIATGPYAVLQALRTAAEGGDAGAAAKLEGHMDFIFGNPFDPVLPGFVEALHEQVEPRNNHWFAYTRSSPTATRAVLEMLKLRFPGSCWLEKDISITTGNFAGILLTLTLLVNGGEEVVFFEPGWFFYETMIQHVGGTSVPVRLKDPFDRFNLDDLEAAITKQTKVIIFNSPHNPSGLVATPEEMKALASLLRRKSEEYGHHIWVLSDEAYATILFDDASHHSLCEYYPFTVMCYTFGKTLLTPGQRVGFMSFSPLIRDHVSEEALEGVRSTLQRVQFTLGFAFANALLQHALPAISRLTIDVAALQHKRDILCSALNNAGYVFTKPRGTFYIWVKSPISNSNEFCDYLATKHKCFMLPGEAFDCPGYFRICLTATLEMAKGAGACLADAAEHFGLAKAGSG